MTVDEGARWRLYQRASAVLGDEEGATLMALTPPVDFTTRTDLGNFELRLGIRIDALDHRIDALDHRMVVLEDRMVVLEDRMGVLENRMVILENRLDALDERLSRLEQKVEELEERIDARFQQFEDRIMRVFYEQLNDAVRGQTRTLVYTLLGTALTLAAVVLAAAQLT